MLLKDPVKKSIQRPIAHEMGDDQFFTKKRLYYLPEVLSEQRASTWFTSAIDG